MEKINIKYFGDVHVNEFFDEKKLYRIEDVVNDDKTNYICFTGDLINSTNFIRENVSKRKKIISFLERLSRISPVIFTLGNHDIFMENNGWQNDWYEEFWKDVSAIDGINMLKYIFKYEDENIYITDIDPGFSYYENNTGHEDKEELIKALKIKKRFYQYLNTNRLNILLSHSPVFMTDKDILDIINEFDVILSGHMHNGLVPPIIDQIIKNNRGFITPDMTLFPDNVRGTKNIMYGDKLIKLMITGGITKISKSRILNAIFPMSVSEFEYDKKTKKIKTIR